MSNNRLFLVLGLAAGGWLLYHLGPILTPFVVAALLAYICDPLVDRLESLRVPRTPGVLIVFILLFSAIGAVVVLVIPVVQAQVAHLVEKIPGYVHWIEERILPRLMERLEVAGDGEPMGLSAFLTQYGDHAASWGTRILASITSSASALLTAVVSLFLIPILTFYMLRDWDRIIDRVGKLVPMRYREVAFQLAGETDTMLGAFFRGQLLVMLALAIMYTTGLMIVGLPHALAIGVVSGLVSFIPYLGLVVGILLAGLTALVETGSPLTLAGVAVVFIVAQFIESNFLTPKLVGDRIGLHPVMVIFALMAGGQLFGFFGVLLALPAAAVIAVLVRFMYARFNQTAGSTETS